jgi:hypothetical protein
MQPDRQPVSNAPARPTRGRGRRWAWLAGFAALALVSCCGFGGAGVAWIALELGVYSTQNNVRLAGSALRAYQEASKTKPGCFLYIEEYDHFTYRVTLADHVNPHETAVRIEERGVPIAIDEQPYRAYFVHLKPTILHDGGADKTQGYDLHVPGARGSDFPGPGRP